MKHYYRIAEQIIAIEAPEAYFDLLPNYAPFISDENEATCLFTIFVHEHEMPSGDAWTHVFTDRSDEDMPRIEMYQQADEWLFRVSMYRDSEVVCAMRCSADWKQVDLYLQPQTARFAMDNTAMLVYAFATADKQTLLFHSSATVLDGKAYLFLGHSGTGKSTHSQQWKAAFPDAELLNDDNPIVRILPDETVRVYGSPWSGKTPCYKNVKAPIGAIVQLSQAPYNKISPLKGLKAYAALIPSISGKRWDRQLADGLHETETLLAGRAKMFHLECLPDRAAAMTCMEAVTSEE